MTIGRTWARDAQALAAGDPCSSRDTSTLCPAAHFHGPEIHLAAQWKEIEFTAEALTI
jgi:hypothetical protein